MQIGDVVILKSGGPRMTVVYIDTDYTPPRLGCEWFLNGKVESGAFPEQAVEIA